MNNNKKYKKWTLGLVAPALVLAPIAVVASCSSSGEEKEAYGIEFKVTQIRAKIHNATQPNDLTNEQFKEEVLNHLDELFSVTGKLPADDFISKNIEIGELQKDDDKKEVSAKVKVNNANTDGKSIEQTITLTGLGFDLTKLKYTIQFKATEDSQEISLTGQESVSVEGMNETKLVQLILTTENKDQILVIDGDNKDDITDEVLASQILRVTEIQPNKTEGKVTFKLSIEKPKDGAGTTLEKTITFIGFKQETDSTPPAETDKFKIKFKAEAEALEGVSDQSVNNFSTGEKIKPVIIDNKDKIFEAEEGNLPQDENWWQEKLTVSKPNLNAAEGSITANISLDGFDTTDSADSSKPTITENGVILKGFRKEAQTVAITEEISTVTLGLNGTVDEITTADEVNANWVLNNKRLLFTKGFNLIKEASDIKDITLTGDSSQQSKKATLLFKVVENKWFETDGNLGTTDKEFQITIKGFPASNTPTKNQLLKNKLDGTTAKPLSITLVDPALGEGTYDEFIKNSANIFNEEFLIKYRKHLLTGDFSKIDAKPTERFLKEYPQNGGFVKVIPSDTAKTIEIKFTILGTKLVGSPNDDDKEYSIVFNGFKASNN